MSDRAHDASTKGFAVIITKDAYGRVIIDIVVFTRVCTFDPFVR